MLEIEIPKDIRRYESKLVSFLTTRQTICAVIAIVIAYLTYCVTSFLPADFSFVLIGIAVLPALLIGWVKPYGMNFEHFAATAFFSTFVCPKYRRYKTNNAYSMSVQKKHKKNKKPARKISKEFTAYK